MANLKKEPKLIAGFGYTSADVVSMLKAECDWHGGQTAFAKKAGCSVPFVNDIVNGHREPSGCVLKALGLIRQVRYVKPHSLGVTVMTKISPQPKWKDIPNVDFDKHRISFVIGNERRCPPFQDAIPMMIDGEWYWCTLHECASYVG